MACRVGITTRPEERKSEWEREYRNFRNWKIIGPFEDRKRAQQVETNVAKTHGCEAHPGGRDPDSTNGPWSVYQFEYDERIESFTESFLNKFKPLQASVRPEIVKFPGFVKYTRMFWAIMHELKS